MNWLYRSANSDRLVSRRGVPTLFRVHPGKTHYSRNVIFIRDTVVWRYTINLYLDARIAQNRGRERFASEANVRPLEIRPTINCENRQRPIGAKIETALSLCLARLFIHTRVKRRNEESFQGNIGDRTFCRLARNSNKIGSHFCCETRGRFIARCRANKWRIFVRTSLRKFFSTD